MVFVKGITPEFLKQVIIGEELFFGSNLLASPIVEEYPSISKESFIDIGIPNKGGKYFSGVYSSSSNVQFFFLESFLVLSHSFAN